jgi:predicted RNase H-like nuclease (RuvC/YqgF family)
MIAILEWTYIVPGAISFITGGSLVAAIVALYKVKPEAGQIVVSAAQGALLVQTGVIENLKAEIQRLTDEVKQLQTENAALKSTIALMVENQQRHDKEIKHLNNQ